MTTAPQKWLAREARDSDLPFIFNSWLKAYRDATAVRGIPNSAYYPAQHHVIAEILADPDTISVIACDLKDPDQIFGWLVADKELRVVHMVYVKQPFRLFGIAKHLMALAIKTTSDFVYSHRTVAGESIAKTKGAKYVSYEYLRRLGQEESPRNPDGAL